MLPPLFAIPEEMAPSHLLRAAAGSHQHQLLPLTTYGLSSYEASPAVPGAGVPPGVAMAAAAGPALAAAVAKASSVDLWAPQWKNFGAMGAEAQKMVLHRLLNAQ